MPILKYLSSFALAGFVLIGLLSTARAESKSPITMPSNARLVFTWSGLFRGDQEVKKEQQHLLSIAESQIVKSSLDVQCRNIYRKWQTSKRNNGSSYDDLLLQMWCEPRSLQQQQIGSLYKSCQTKPQAQCFEPAFLDYLNAYELTNYYDIYAPKNR